MAGSGSSPSGAEPAPPDTAFAIWLIREVVGLVFVVGWLALFAVELFTGRYTLPLWVHCVGVGALAFCLGLNAADLVYRPPRPGHHER